MSTSSDTSSIQKFLAESLRVGEPDVAGPLAVFPVFGPEPRADYTSFADAHRHGAKIGELTGGASVRDLEIVNPTGRSILLFEGEEIHGAQQNRTFDVTVLVEAGGRLVMPVSCVEAGRWDGSRHAEEFRPSPQAAYPALRRAKARHAHREVLACRDPRADQGEVWQDVAHKSSLHGAHSPTGAMHDVYEARRATLRDITERIRPHDGQCGALVAIAGRFAVLDYVSRAEVFAQLHGPLLQGYALDALEVLDTRRAQMELKAQGETDGPDATDDFPPAPAVEDARGFASLVEGAHPLRHPSIGRGEDLRFAEDGVAGSGLADEDELVALSAFPGDGSDPAGPSLSSRRRRVARPSTRRRTV
jgi:hypothetical protein